MSPEALASLPASTRIWIDGYGESTVGQVRGSPVEYITTDEAARRFSYAPETWARWAPSIPGAFKDRLWRLPLAGCRAHIARLRTPERRRRVPWKAKSAPPARARAARLEAR